MMRILMAKPPSSMTTGQLVRAFEGLGLEVGGKVEQTETNTLESKHNIGKQLSGQVDFLEMEKDEADESWMLTFQGKKDRGWEDTLNRIKEWNPDFIMTVNRHGTVGTPLPKWCEENRTVLFHWFVDDPIYLELRKEEVDLDWVLCCLFNPRLEETARVMGCRHVTSLEIGWDPKLFPLISEPIGGEKKYPLAFMGSLYTHMMWMTIQKLNRKMGKWGKSILSHNNAEGSWSFKRLTDFAAKWLMEDMENRRPIEAVRGMIDRTFPLHPFLDKIEADLALLWELEVCYRMRRTVVEKLLPKGLHVWGDKEWLGPFPEFRKGGKYEDRYHGRVMFGEDLAGVYRECEFVIDVPRMQSMGAMTQRDLDAKACGATVLGVEQDSHLEILLDAFDNDDPAKATYELSLVVPPLGEVTMTRKVEQILDMVGEHRKKMLYKTSPIMSGI